MATDGTAFQLANDFIDGMRNSTYTFKGSNIGEHFICINIYIAVVTMILHVHTCSSEFSKIQTSQTKT